MSERIVHYGRLDGSPVCPAPRGSAVVYFETDVPRGKRLCLRCKKQREGSLLLARRARVRLHRVNELEKRR